tara:strand:+ start:384 stop:503 length:120 start_codon:yes stop_codon:yes gene_type:complete
LLLLLALVVMLSTVEDRDVVVPKKPIVCGVCLGEEEAKG